MKVYMHWYGGSSYSFGSPKEDAEEFDSIKAAKRTFEARADFDPYCPCVDENTEAHLYFVDPSTVSGDPYPDAILTLGPRGGVRMERC